MSIATILVCDRCLRPYSGSRRDMVDDRNVWNRGTTRAPAHVLRTEAKPEGWSVGVRAWTKRTQQGAMDFCPTCVEEARKAAEQAVEDLALGVRAALDGDCELGRVVDLCRAVAEDYRTVTADRDKLRAEAEQLKRERDTEEARADDAEGALNDAETTLKAAESDRDRLRAELATARERLGMAYGFQMDEGQVWLSPDGGWRVVFRGRHLKGLHPTADAAFAALATRGSTETRQRCPTCPPSISYSCEPGGRWKCDGCGRDVDARGSTP